MLYKIENLVIKNSENLELSYGNINFKKNKLTIIKGKSGIGKTTLLKALGLIAWNLHENSKIELFIADGDKGKVISRLKSKTKQELRKKHFSFIFQDDHLIDALSVRNNILFPSLITAKTKLKVLEDQLAKYLKNEFLKPIKDRLDHSCSVLSGGEKKKVALLRAILKDPDILIADEPWTNMGKNDVEAYTKFFVKQRKNKSTILATHDDRVIRTYAVDYPGITDFFELKEKTGEEKYIKHLELKRYQVEKG